MVEMNNVQEIDTQEIHPFLSQSLKVPKGPRKQTTRKVVFEAVVVDELEWDLSPLTNEQYCFIAVHSSQCTLKWINVFGHWYSGPTEMERKFGEKYS